MKPLGKSKTLEEKRRYEREKKRKQRKRIKEEGKSLYDLHMGRTRRAGKRAVCEYVYCICNIQARCRVPAYAYFPIHSYCQNFAHCLVCAFITSLAVEWTANIFSSVATNND
jgi:hypothetical protein